MCFYNISGLAVESVAAAALYVYLAFALRDADICAAAGAFEEAVALALGETILPRGVLVLPAVEIGEVGAVFSRRSSCREKARTKAEISEKIPSQINNLPRKPGRKQPIRNPARPNQNWNFESSSMP